MAEGEKPDKNILDHFSVENFVSKQLELLDLERSAEVEENKHFQECNSVKELQKKGVCIPKLRLASVSTGLFGRSLMSFEPLYGNSTLPTHSISSGDIVGIANINVDGKHEIITSGVVSRVCDSSVIVAFEKNSDSSDLENDAQYMIIKLANDVTYRRLKRALKLLESKGRDMHLVNVLFGEKTPSASETYIPSDLSFFNCNLNDSQKEAVKFSLSQKEVAILHGPPGTGKTTTVVECILQATSQKLKVLACAPSNVAVDNLVEKLAQYKIKMVRLGHPARFLSSIQQYSLDAIVSHYDGSDIIDEMHKEIDKLRTKISKTKGSYARKSLWAENKNLLKEVKEREKSIVKQVLTNVDVVLCTLTSASDDGPLKHIEKDHFNICFIDECSQGLEASCWIPLLLVKKCILAGDYNQLPPTILSEKAAQGGLSLTLMERVLKLHGSSIKKMLTIQYRMHSIIMQWPSKQLYENKLLAHETVSTHLLKDLPSVESNENTLIPLLLIDTAGCDIYELQADDEISKGNEGEADLVALHVNSLVRSGITPSDIGVITPYNLQVDLIKSRMSGKFPKLEIKSVDGFQGREKEAIVLSLVRSNDDGEIGFLAEERRINVAVTRARRHLAVICNSETVSHNDFLKSFINYCIEKGEVRTAFEYEKEIGQYAVPLKKQAAPNKCHTGTISKRKVSRKSDSSEIDKTGSKKCSQEEEEHRLAVEEKYKQVIKTFVACNEKSLSFPPSLSAFERRAVHEIAEQLGLLHVSTGEGSDRSIEISKPDTKSLSSGLVSAKEYESLIEIVTSDLQYSIEKDKAEIEQDSCYSQIETAICSEMKYKNSNQIALATLHDKTQKPKNKQSTKPKLKILKLKESANADDDENFDALIEQVIKADKTCSFEKCKKNVAVLAQVCQFCKGRFCYSHFIPEAHGCGSAAKAHARSQIRKDGVIYSGSGKPEKKVDPIKHSYLQKKLDKKIGELTKQRKSKPKN